MATAHVNVKGRTSMDGRGWSAGLRKMETGTKGAAGRMAGSMAGALGGVFAVGFLVSATRRIVAHADQVHKTAVRIGASTDTIQKFDFAATQSGATMGDVEKSFINTAKAMESAKQGLTTHIRAFQAFGISMQMLNVMSPEQVFLKVADAIEKAGGAMDKAKSLQDIMGRGGKAMIPAFVSGFTGLAASAPQGIDEETILKLVKFNDEMDRMKREMLPAGASGAGFLADMFEMFSESQGPGGGVWDALMPGIPATGIGALIAKIVQAGKLSTAEVQEIIDQANKSRMLTPTEMRNKAAGKIDTSASTLENWLGFRSVGQQDTGDQAAAAKAWSKPSLQLNSLQRIGAAVTQSADPIAFEKSNNKLLTQIQRNTRKTADHLTSDEL
jgi:hypothetical protein